jgi:hypothetical protein
MIYFPDLSSVLWQLFCQYWIVLYLLIGMLFCFDHIMEAMGDAAIAWLFGWGILLPITLIRDMIWWIKERNEIKSSSR